MSPPMHPDSGISPERASCREPYCLADPDCPGIDPAEFEAGIEAAIVRDLIVRPEDLEALKNDPLWWRAAITEPGGRRVQVDTPNGWIMSDWASLCRALSRPRVHRDADRRAS